jgi:hypothetical protein
MIKLIAKIYELRKTHGHPCIKELIKLIESNWFLRWLKKFVRI